MIADVLPRLAYLGIANALAMLCLLPMSDHDKDVEILALRHQITVLQRQFGSQKPRFAPITNPGELTNPRIHRRDRLGGILHEYEHAA